MKKPPSCSPEGEGRMKREAMPSGWHSPPLGEDGRELYLL